MSFDLNIDNYTKQELASLFELPPNYDDSILEIKESKLRENIMKNTEINKQKDKKLKLESGLVELVTEQENTKEIYKTILTNIDRSIALQLLLGKKEANLESTITQLKDLNTKKIQKIEQITKKWHQGTSTVHKYILQKWHEEQEQITLKMGQPCVCQLSPSCIAILPIYHWPAYIL